MRVRGSQWVQPVRLGLLVPGARLEPKVKQLRPVLDVLAEWLQPDCKEPLPREVRLVGSKDLALRLAESIEPARPPIERAP
jgi:hypothetical protein